MGENVKLGYTFCPFLRKISHFFGFFNFLQTITIFPCRISFCGKNKSCEKFCYLSITYFLKFFYADLICQLSISLSVCFLTIKEFISSHVMWQRCIHWKFLFLKKQNVLQQSRQSLLWFHHIYKANGCIS